MLPNRVTLGGHITVCMRHTTSPGIPHLKLISSELTNGAPQTVAVGGDKNEGDIFFCYPSNTQPGSTVAAHILTT